MWDDNLRFRRKIPSVLFALLVMLLTCLFHFRSLDIVTPRYLAESAIDKAWSSSSLFFVDFCYRPLWNVPEIAFCTSRRSLGPQIIGSSGKRLNTISHNFAHIVDYAHITWVQNKGAFPAIWTIHTHNVHNIQA